MSFDTKNKILSCFYFVYFILLILPIVKLGFFPRFDASTVVFVELGEKFGQASLYSYILTLLPGIAGRLSINNGIVKYLRIFRRQFGILMYLLAVNHLFLVKVAYIAKINEILPQNVHELMGSLAVICLFFLFITSNNYSVSKLKLMWFKIHKLTYIAMFFIFAHIAIVDKGFNMYLIGTIISLELLSFVWRKS